MSIATAIARFRAKQADQFTDEATVSRPVGEPTTDSTTGEVTQDYTDVLAGPCKIRPLERSGSDVTAGETRVRQVDVGGKWPVDSDIRNDDIVTVTASEYDASMVGRQYRVTEVNADGWQIARVVGLEETLVPELNVEG